MGAITRLLCSAEEWDKDHSRARLEFSRCTRRQVSVARVKVLFGGFSGATFLSAGFVRNRLRINRAMVLEDLQAVLANANVGVFVHAFGAVLLVVPLLWRRLVWPRLSAALDRVFWGIVQCALKVLLVLWAVYFLSNYAFVATSAYRAEVLERALRLKTIMETGARATATSSNWSKGLAAASILGWVALKAPSKRRGGRPGQAAQSTEDAKPDTTTTEAAAQEVHVCAIKELEAQAKVERERLLQEMEKRLEGRLKIFEEDLGNLYSRVRSLEKRVKYNRPEDDDQEKQSKRGGGKSNCANGCKQCCEAMDAMEELTFQHNMRIEELSDLHNYHRKKIDKLAEEMRWMENRLEKEIRDLRGVIAMPTVVASTLPAEPTGERWEDYDEEDVRYPRDQRQPRVNFSEPPAREARMERSDERHDERYGERRDERREYSPMRRREDPEFERLKNPDLPLPEDFYRRYPERIVWQVLSERKRRRPKAPGSGFFLSKAEAQVAQRSLAELGVLWRKFRCEEDGKPLRDYEWDHWDLGYLTPEECTMHRADIKRLLQRRREDERARLSAQAGRPKEYCSACGNWHAASKTCIAAHHAVPTKRPGVMEKTILQASGKNSLSVRTIPVPDGEELRKEATRLRAIKQGVEEREALAESLSKDARGDGGLPPKALSAETIVGRESNADDRMADERRSF